MDVPDRSDEIRWSGERPFVDRPWIDGMGGPSGEVKYRHVDGPRPSMRASRISSTNQIEDRAIFPAGNRPMGPGTSQIFG